MKEEKETHTIGFGFGIDVELGWQGEVKRKKAYVLP